MTERPQKLRNLAIISLLGATLGYVFINVSIRLLGEGFQPITLTYLRLAVGFLLGFLFLGRKLTFKSLQKISVKDWFILIGMGTIGYAAAIYFFTLGVFHTKLLVVSVLSSTIPFFTLIYSLIFFRKIPKLLILPFLIISFIGVSIVSTKSFFPSIAHFGLGEIFVLLSAASSGIYPIFRRLLSSKISNSEITLTIIPIAVITLILFALSMGEKITVSSFFHWQVLLGLFIGGFLNVATTQIENFAFEHLDSVLATQLFLTENIFSPIVGFLLYKELPSLPEVIGAILIIVGIYGVNKFTE